MVGDVLLDVDDVETVEPRTDFQRAGDPWKGAAGERERQAGNVVGQHRKVADDIGVHGQLRVGPDVDVVEDGHSRGGAVPAGQSGAEQAERGVEQPGPGVEVQ